MSEKTEQPTQKRLDDVRKKGNVPQSKDFAKAIMMASFLVYLLFATPPLLRQTIDLLTLAGKAAYGPFDNGLSTITNLASEILIDSLIPLVIVVLLVGFFADMIQNGFLFAPEKVKPNIENVNFIKRTQQLFSARSLVEFFKSIFKVVFLTGTVYVILSTDIADIARLPGHSPDTMVSVLIRLLMKLFVAATILFLLFGGPDLLLQKMLFARENKMSKDEVFREYKEMEGDPHINSKRKHLHQEIASGAGSKAGLATAVVVNPTHVAVALYYKKDEVPLPIVLAKGEEEDAREIVRIARENQIPIVQNIPVARALLVDGMVDDYIPDWLIEPVAEFLKTVAELSQDGPVDQAEMD